MALLELRKSANKNVAIVGDVITYTLIATNSADMPLYDVSVYDPLDTELEFVAGSVRLDNKALPNASILADIQLGTMAAGQSRVITFEAKIVDETADGADNIAYGQFSYQLLGGPVQRGTVASNNFNVDLYRSTVVLTKTVNQQGAMLKDVITYTVVLENRGDVTAYNILFKDILPKQGKLVGGTFKINGTVVNNVNLETGIIVGTIVPGGKITLMYNVEIVGSNCSGMLVNQASATYTYRLPNGEVGTRDAIGEESMVELMLEISTFKQLSIESYLTIPAAKPDIETINKITGTIDNLSCHVIETMKNISVEGQQLTGYKLIVRGVLNISIEYTALESTQSVHSAHYSVPFSTFIILPPDYQIGSRLDITGLVEDIYYQALDTRNFFANTTALINVKILSC